jgi:hypothetical protein
MATSITGISLPLQASVIPAANVRARRRSISPQAGHALELLGHAIEYLSDEYVNEGGLFASRDPRIEAIQLLMARNREIYFACPELPTMGERLRSWIHSD